jgi:hypothetical protein
LKGEEEEVVEEEVYRGGFPRFVPSSASQRFRFSNASLPSFSFTCYLDLVTSFTLTPAFSISPSQRDMFL